MSPEELLEERRTNPRRAAERVLLLALTELTWMKSQAAASVTVDPLDPVEALIREAADRLSAFQVVAGRLDKWPSIPAPPRSPD